MKKIIDCFTFFNELDLVEIRLKYLYDVVDHFVIIEADMTHSGNEKPYIFQQSLERFAPLKDKIIYIPAKMKHFDPGKEVEWKREGYQRECIAMGLKKIDLHDNDLILISDLDEIPDKKILEDLKTGRTEKLFRENKKDPDLRLILKGLLYSLKRIRYKLLKSEKYKMQVKLIYYTLIKKFTPPINFNMWICNYYVNYLDNNGFWYGTQCLEARWLKVFSTNEMRNVRNAPIHTINKSGWHFSYLGGKDLIKFKLKNFAHQEFNIKEIVSDDYIDFCIKNGYNLFEYYKNPGTKPHYEKKDITYLPQDLQKIVVDYKNLVLE